MFGWDAEEAEAALRAMLPAGWRFEHQDHEGEWLARLRDDAGEVAFESVYPDARLVLFNAIGFLLNRVQSPSRHPLWSRGARQDRRGPRRPGELGLPSLGPIPDPADLDPAAVDLVYMRRP